MFCGCKFCASCTIEVANRIFLLYKLMLNIFSSRIKGYYMQGIFKPKNKKKYKGDSSNIVYRSSWELKYMMELDSNPDVLAWASEEMSIPYVSPIDQRIHRYFPDFLVEMKEGTQIKTYMVEIKPYKQTIPPVKTSKSITKRYITEVMTWGVNEAKWKAATEYCKDRNWQFNIMTEIELGIKF